MGNEDKKELSFLEAKMLACGYKTKESDFFKSKEYIELVNQFIKKNEDIRNGKISKAKFILVDGLLWSLIYNIRLYIGVKIL